MDRRISSARWWPSGDDADGKRNACRICMAPEQSFDYAQSLAKKPEPAAARQAQKRTGFYTHTVPMLLRTNDRSTHCSSQFPLMLNYIHKEKTMRTAMLAAIAAICLGLVATSTVSAAPTYGASMGAAAASLDLRQDAYVYRPYRRYDGYRGYYGYGGYQPCFQTCSNRAR